MAKQKGIIKLEGTIGDITFVKTRNGYVAREKTGLTGDRIASDPAFQRTRENGAEFGRAGKASKLIRGSFRSLLQTTADSGVTGRLTKELMKVIQSDGTSSRGQRKVSEGECTMLEGFDFNESGKLGTTLFAPFTTTIDRAGGDVTTTIPPFVPNVMIGSPAGASHYKITAAAAAIDFDGNSYEHQVAASTILPLDSTATAALNLANALAPASTLPMFIALGIEFYQEVNGEMYALNNGAFNALQIVKVDVV